jgi:hypothetical protein
MTYQSGSPRTPGLRLPAQSAPVDRTGARTSATGDGPGVEAAWWGSDAFDWVKSHGPDIVKGIQTGLPIAMALA